MHLMARRYSPQFVVISNYPNPFSSDTWVILDVPATMPVQAEVFDALGRRKLRLIDQELSPGRYEIRINAQDWASGLYFVQVTSTEGVRRHKMIRIGQ